MFCANCGNRISESDKFCPKCGIKLQGKQSSSHNKVAQTNIDQQNEHTELKDQKQQVTSPQTLEQKAKLYMKSWGVGFIITGILVLLIFQLKLSQVSITLFEIIPVDRPIWGISLILFGAGLFAVGSIR